MTTPTNTQQSTDLVRPIDGRLIAGVAAGLGRRFAINPWWFRIGLSVLTLFGGFGLVLYAIGWLLIPEESAGKALLSQWIGDFDSSNTPMMIGVGLIAIAALILATNFNIFSGNLLLAAILFVVGVLLYRGDIGGSKSPRDPDDGGGTMPEEATTAVALDDPDGGGSDPPDVTEPVVPAEPPPDPPAPEAKPRSILGQLTAAAAFILVGGLALLDAAEILYPEFFHYAALTLGVVGAGLIVGTIFGRARWLIVIGVLLVPVVLVASVVPRWTFNGETGDVYYGVTSVFQIEDQYELAAGALHVDLSTLEAEPGETRAFTVSVGAGEVRIDVPSDVAVRVEASVGIGAVDLFGDQRAGIGVESTESTGSPATLVITAEAGFGKITVREG